MRACRASSSTRSKPVSPSFSMRLVRIRADQRGGGMIGEGTGGVTEGMKRHVVLPLAGTLAETDHVPAMGSCMHSNTTSRRISARGGDPGGGIESLPLWFVEGLAEYLSIGRSILIRPCGFAMRPARNSCRRSKTSLTANIFPIGGDRPCGRMSAANTETISSATSSGPRSARAMQSLRSRNRHWSTPRSSRPTGTPTSGRNTRR